MIHSKDNNPDNIDVKKRYHQLQDVKRELVNKDIKIESSVGSYLDTKNARYAMVFGELRCYSKEENNNG